MRIQLLAIGLALLLATSSASARTWYVNISGTGDAPTIAAALDSAVYGDTVLVGPGNYETEYGHSVGAGVVVISEMGPLQTRVTGAGAGGYPAAIFGLLWRAELHGFWVEHAAVATIGAKQDCVVANNIIWGLPGHNIEIQEPCRIINNLFLDGQGIAIASAAAGTIFWLNIVYCGFTCGTSPFASMTCNDLLSPDSPCLQAILEVWGTSNFSADPEFCGIEGSGNYYLQSDSPCAPGNTELSCGLLVGPLPVGCSTVETEARSWGEIKALYR